MNEQYSPAPSMPLTRRSMLLGSAGLTAAYCLNRQSQNKIPSDITEDLGAGAGNAEFANSQYFPAGTYSIEPVVGDGKWISRRPPKDVYGLFEPRLFDVEVGLEVTGVGNTSQFVGTTVAPVACPEQKILSVRVEKNNCLAEIQNLSSNAARLVVAGSLTRGARLGAKAIYRMEISKSHFGYSTENLLADTKFSTRKFGQWLGNSPGIETRSKEVSKHAERLSRGHEHPLDVIKSFQEWVFSHIKGRPMKYTSVQDAIKNGVGDCEERAGTFVALCRSIGIPARLVWVPNHAWAECCLYDLEGQPCWIPVHTAAYNWLGWTGAHELVLQKGDRIELPNNKRKVRLVADWLSWKGSKPKVRFTGVIRPVKESGLKDAGPGCRIKDKEGKWNLDSSHADDKYLRP